MSAVPLLARPSYTPTVPGHPGSAASPITEEFAPFSTGGAAPSLAGRATSGAPVSLLTHQLGALAAATAADERVRLFSALPDSIKNEIYALVWIADGCVYEEGRGKELVDQQMQRWLFEPMPQWVYSEGNTLLEQLIARAAAPEKLQAENIRHTFLRHVSSSSHLMHKQLLALYRNLPPTIQSTIPSSQQPPYYGYGVRADLHRTYGAHVHKTKGGVQFRVHAPNATQVWVVSMHAGKVTTDPTHCAQMTQDPLQEGDWIAHMPRAAVGWEYMYHVTTAAGEVLEKIDPFSFGTHSYGDPDKPDGEPTQGLCHFHHESVVSADPADFWRRGEGKPGGKYDDCAHIAYRAQHAAQARPRVVMEVNPHYFCGPGPESNWDTFARDFIPYAQWLGITDVQLMTTMDFPNPASMGYQVTAHFSTNHRMGDPAGFQRFIGSLHRAGLSATLDFLFNHTAVDHFGLSCFDGSFVYENGNSEWGCPRLDTSSRYVRDFILSMLDHWVANYHLDGIRFDGVDNFLRGQNLDSHDLLREMTTHVRTNFPGVRCIAETFDTEFYRMTHPIKFDPSDAEFALGKQGGYGFHLQWGMGWMHKMLKEFISNAEHGGSHLPRSFDERSAAWGAVEAAFEAHLDQLVSTVISHDEVSMMKGSLIEKMPGNPWQKFAGLRTTIAALFFARGSEKLLIMGSEFGQSTEYGGDVKEEKKFPTWEMEHNLAHPERDEGVRLRKGMVAFYQELVKFYKETPAFWELDGRTDRPWLWVNTSDYNSCVHGFVREDAAGNRYLVVQNFKDKGFDGYDFEFVHPAGKGKMDGVTALQERLNSNRGAFGGSDWFLNNEQVGVQTRTDGTGTRFAKINIPPHATLVFQLHRA